MLKKTRITHHSTSKAHFGPARRNDAADSLTSAGWNKIVDLIAPLQPLAEASKTAQLTATLGGFGALHTVLTTMEQLLSHLELQRNKHTHLPASHFKACVNLGWKKLDMYYSFTDIRSAYHLAVLLNPR